jgi:hypothetical protein
MKAYVMCTGAIFGLITLAHLLRIISEGQHLLREPLYVVLTLTTAGLCIWALSLLRPRRV